MIGEALPDPAVVGLDQRAIPAGDAEIFQRDALAVEHAKDVVIGNDQQLGRRAEGRRRVGQQRGRHVAVRADDRQVFDRRVQRARERALGRVGVKTAVGR